MSKKKQLWIITIGWLLSVLAVLFAFAETVYFGCNWKPSCQAEVICDKISIVVCWVGVGVIIVGSMWKEQK